MSSVKPLNTIFIVITAIIVASGLASALLAICFNVVPFLFGPRPNLGAAGIGLTILLIPLLTSFIYFVIYCSLLGIELGRKVAHLPAFSRKWPWIIAGIIPLVFFSVWEIAWSRWG